MTTQFISNIERGVTPLPPAHVPTLVAALKVSEQELLQLLEREYTAKLSERLGKPAGAEDAVPTTLLSGSGGAEAEFIRSIAEAYRSADPKTRENFENAAGSILKIQRAADSSQSGESGTGQGSGH